MRGAEHVAREVVTLPFVEGIDHFLMALAMQVVGNWARQWNEF